MFAEMPLLLMTGQGADPSQELQEVANSSVGAAAYQQLAMGQGQTQPALDLLLTCAQSGVLGVETALQVSMTLCSWGRPLHTRLMLLPSPAVAAVFVL